MTFDDWYTKVFLPSLPSYRGFVNKQDMKASWNAAIESTKTKVEPLTSSEIEQLFPFKGYGDLKTTQGLNHNEGQEYVGPEDC